MAGGPFNLIICMNREIAVVDIDGTLCVVGDRRKYMEQNDPDWESFYRDDFKDLPIRTVCDFVRQMSYITARNSTPEDTDMASAEPLAVAERLYADYASELRQPSGCGFQNR